MAAAPVPTGTPGYKTTGPFKFLMVMCAVWLFLILTTAGSHGVALLAGAAELAACYGGMSAVNLAETFGTSHKFRAMFNPHTQSWSYLYGNLSVAIAVWQLSYVWREVHAGWYNGWWWSVLTFAIGAAAGFGFHYMDIEPYQRVKAYDQLNARSKRWHDHTTYTVLFGGIVFLLVPAIIAMIVGYLHQTSVDHFWAAIGALAFWVIMVICDMVRKPDPFKMHPPGERW